MTRPVRLLFFTQTLDCETCLTARQILDELPLLSDKIAIDEINVVIDADRAKRFGIDRAPAVVPVWQDEPRRRAGFEDPLSRRAVGLRVHLARAGGAAGRRPAVDLSAASLARLAAVDKPVTMQVFTTPT